MRFIKNGPSIPGELLTARDDGRVIFFVEQVCHMHEQNYQTSVSYRKKYALAAAYQKMTLRIDF